MGTAGRTLSGHSDLQSARAEDAIDVPGAVNQGTMVPRALTALTVVGFAIPVVAYFWFVHRYGVNAIWLDQWDDINVIGHPTFGNLWALHNENRIFFPNLIVLVLASTIHFNIHTEEYVSGVMLVAAVGLIILAHKRRSPSTPWLYYCPVAFIMLSLVQFQNSLWGFQMAWYLVLLALAGTLFLLDRATLTTTLLVGAIVLAVIGSFSSLQGLLIWPAGLVLIYHRRRRRGQTAVWIAAALAAGAVYFYHASYISLGPTRTYFYAHPIKALEFFFAAIGDIVGEGLRADGHNQGIIAFGVVIVAVGLWTTITYGIRRSEGGSPLGVALICFGLLFAAVTTAGRASQGISGAGASRYTTFDLLILVGCYLAILDRRTDRAGARAATWGAWMTVTIAILLVLVLGTRNGLANAAVWHQTFAEAADVTVNIDEVPDSVVGAALYPAAGESVAFIRHAAQIAKTRHLSVFAPGAAICDAEYQPLIESLPVSVVLRPSYGAKLRRDELLAATAQETFGPFEIGVAKVDFQLTGGDLRHVIIGNARFTLYGWIDLWNTTTVANGSYVLQSVASNSEGKTTESVGVAVVVDNH
jgi:hypothetical protein